MAELPGGACPADVQESRCLEVPGDEAVDAGSGERSRPEDGQRRRGRLGERCDGRLDLDEVADVTLVDRGRHQRGVVRQRDRVVGPCTVHHRARHEDDPPCADGGCTLGDGAGGPDHPRPAGGGRRGEHGGEVVGGAHEDDDVRAGEQVRAPGPGDVPDPPRRRAGLAAPLVGGDDPQSGGPERGGDRAAGGTGGTDDRHPTAAAPRANRSPCGLTWTPLVVGRCVGWTHPHRRRPRAGMLERNGGVECSDGSTGGPSRIGGAGPR